MEHDHQHLLHVEGAPHLKIKALLYNDDYSFWYLGNYLTFSLHLCS